MPRDIDVAVTYEFSCISFCDKQNSAAEME